MNKTHEELAREAAKVLGGFKVVRDPKQQRLFVLESDVGQIAQNVIFDAITAAVQAERERSRDVVKLAINRLNQRRTRSAKDCLSAELARLSLNDSPPALSNNA